jgi:hypothetical protein
MTKAMKSDISSMRDEILQTKEAATRNEQGA